MPARIPLDVDLEDKLLYGLTPMRLAYLLVGLVTAFGCWTSQWSPPPARAAIATILIVAAAVAAWGRWHARALDEWAIDVAVFVVASHCLKWRFDWLKRWKRDDMTKRNRMRQGPQPDDDCEAPAEAA